MILSAWQTGQANTQKALPFFSDDDINLEFAPGSNKTYTLLDKKISLLSPKNWFEKHALVSYEDFVKEPHRNRLNVLLSRTLHLNHHYGQIALALKLAGKKRK